MNNGYLVQFPGASKAFANSIHEVKMLVEAFLEAPLYAREEGESGMWFTEEILERLTEGILYAEITPLGAEDDIEYPLATPINVRELFTFTLRIISDQVKIHVNFQKKYRHLKAR